MVWLQHFIKSESCSLEVFPGGTFALNISSACMGHHLINYCLDFTCRIQIITNKSQLLFNFCIHILLVTHGLPYETVKGVRSQFRYSKNMDLTLKFLPFNCIWGYDDRIYGGLPQFVRLGPDTRISPTGMPFISFLVFMFVCFYYLSIAVLLVSFKRMSCSVNCMNSSLESSPPPSFHLSITVWLHLFAWSLLQQILMTARYVPKEISYAHTKLST